MISESEMQELIETISRSHHETFNKNMGEKREYKGIGAIEQVYHSNALNAILTKLEGMGYKIHK